MKSGPAPGFERQPLRLMAIFGSAGFTIVAASLLGFAAGHWIDRRWQTTPAFTILLLLAGFLAAVLNIYFRVKPKKNP